MAAKKDQFVDVTLRFRIEDASEFQQVTAIFSDEPGQSGGVPLSKKLSDYLTAQDWQVRSFVSVLE